MLSLCGALCLWITNGTSFASSMQAQMDWTEIARRTVAAVIWIPYVLVSKRVKNTFVE